MKHHPDAPRAPTENHDERLGYEVGSLWHLPEDHRVFLCLSSKAGEAVWQEVMFVERLAEVAWSGEYSHLKGQPKLGDAASRNVGYGPGSVAKGDDRRINGALQGGENLKDLSSVKAALTNLGVRAAAVELLSQQDDGRMRRVLRLEKGKHIVTPEAANEAFQPQHDALTLISKTGAQEFGVSLLTAGDAVDAWKRLGLEPGKDVQRFHKTTRALQGASRTGVQVVSADNPAAMLEVLGLKSGIAYLPAREVKDSIRALERQIEKLSAKIEALAKEK
jgi:hypothetical protein